jgi:hypothetical protein
MKKFLTSATCLIFLALLVHGANSVQKPTTGDRKLDSYLVEIDKQAEAEPDVFFRQLSQRHNIPEEEIRQAKERYRLNYGDTYMAAALSGISKRPMGVFAEEYNKKQGQGWGVMAQNMGIKPGSPEFHQMKANARDSVGHMKTMAKARHRERKQEMKRARQYDRELKKQAKAKGQGKGK